jgi:hypothetical protein
VLPAGLFDQAVPGVIHARRPGDVRWIDAGCAGDAFGALPVGIQFCQDCL